MFETHLEFVAMRLPGLQYNYQHDQHVRRELKVVDGMVGAGSSPRILMKTLNNGDGIRTHQQAADSDVAERSRDLRVKKLKVGGEGGWVRWWMLHVQDKRRTD